MATPIQLAVLLVCIASVHATHFRYGVITWRREAKNSSVSWQDAYYYRFRVVTAWEASFHMEPFPSMIGEPEGTPFPYLDITGGGFFFGDNTSHPWDASSCYSLGDPSQNPLGVLYIECFFEHEYEEPGEYEAYFLSCCRITRFKRLMNNDELQTRVSVKVMMDNNIRDSLITGWLPIATIPLKTGDNVAQQQFVAFDPVGNIIEFVHADSYQMSGFSGHESVPDSVPPTDDWTISSTTGLVTWYNVSELIHGDFYNAQIVSRDGITNRTVVVDFLYRVQVVDQFCVGPAQGGCADDHMLSCANNTVCTCGGICEFPSLPEFIDPTPAHGAVIVVFATQTNPYYIQSNRTGSHCCEPGEYLFYIEGPFPTGFRTGRTETGTNPFLTTYTWTPTVEQNGLHQLCWSVCAANDDLAGFVDVCSSPHCFAIYVSLKPNYAPSIHKPDESFGEYGVIAYHQTNKTFTDLWVNDDSGVFDIEVHISVDQGHLTLGSFPEGLQFLNDTNGTNASHIEVFGSLVEINNALYGMIYYGEEGDATVTMYVNDHGNSGMGVNEPRTSLTVTGEFAIRILPACNNPCPDLLTTMKKIYTDMNGDTWEQNGNWNTGDPCWNNWHGVECKNGNVVGISLPHNKLSGTLPCELGCLSNLRYLYLMGNEIGGLIPPKLGQLTCLTNLGLYNNKLSWTLPPELANMTSLEYMHLNDNELEGVIPQEYGNMPNLKQLMVQNNKLNGVVPGTLWNLKNLSYMWVYNNDISYAPPSWSAERFYTEDELKRRGTENKM